MNCQLKNWVLSFRFILMFTSGVRKLHDSTSSGRGHGGKTRLAGHRSGIHSVIDVHTSYPLLRKFWQNNFWAFLNNSHESEDKFRLNFDPSKYLSITVVQQDTNYNNLIELIRHFNVEFRARKSNKILLNLPKERLIS